MNDAVVVFGGSGFVGTHLVRHLAADSADDVVSIDLLPPRETLAGVDYRIGDVRDLAGLDLGRPVARIYNFAAVHTTPGHPTHDYYDTNILGALEVTRFAARSGAREIVFTSSISVYGPSEDTKTEASPPAPESAYGHSKLIAERLHRHWQEAAPDRRLVIVRPAVVFGPGEGGNFARLAALLKKGVFVYPGRKDTIKACIYVQDLLEAIEFARSQPESVTLFNAAYPQRYTLEQIVETLIRRHFPKARTVLVPLPVVLAAAKLLTMLDVFGLGIHPDRVMKLVRSTDIYPAWLVSRQRLFPDALDRAVELWSAQSHGTFV
ncbi:NAD-dependent epimerase/dehydratase family protein [Blastochloris viridis]|uniref:UDP-glucose 4-epimerase n=1 Tax=Blastochloris viridis TaxID=1079 RepID=A0A0H5BCJ0_BLAVI|nr:NAD-dependent epimerase/dehydratase family protein [Blastochloris viridis]ALK08695.1 UDP-glucose 4-epimerase [Blastochloris viridis]BAR98011.1 UDP-glucose 4-epimerase [Blastochloris viridis]CUU41358.1 UDP-glucose 4-epimerase [Blastochloris viridis]